MTTAMLPALAEPEFLQLQRLMQEVSGIRLAEHKRSLVAGRLMKRLRHHGLDNFTSYLRLLMAPSSQVERRLVIDLLTTNETYFFREPQHFSFLGDWLARRRGPVRIWSAACSSGEEPYCLAMVAAERAAGDWSVTASDLSQRVLAQARTGVYSLDQARHFPPQWLERHCLKGIEDQAGRFRVAAPLRERVEFREINLSKELPAGLGPFEVIFLRNVLIYFSPGEKHAIVSRLLQRLQPDGLLFVGHAESLHGLGLPVTSVQPSVYRLNDNAATLAQP